ncbi:7613_t:CDS:2, partial [Diversispora eburnea]
MKLSIFSIVLLLSFIKFVSSKCFDFDSYSNFEVTECGELKEFIKTPVVDRTIKIEINTDKSKPGMCNTGGKVNMFEIDFTCDKNTSNKTCEKARNAFETAGMIISSAIKLKKKIHVNATFTKFCGVFLNCSGGSSPIGYGIPARFIQLKDEDSVIRLYPQALVKQFDSLNHPEYNKYDITALFNSESTAYWFSGDPNPPTYNQIDFTLVILHEFIHGLGLITLWVDYFNPTPEGLVPFPSFLKNPNGFTDYNGTITFTGFEESVFDKYLVFTDNDNNKDPEKYLTSIREKINSFAGGPEANTKFDNSSSFITSFVNSSNYNYAKDLLTKATIPRSIGFLPHNAKNNNDIIIVETSLKPLITGSSLSHLDNDTYVDTPDFLMRYRAPRGISLETLYLANGGDKDNKCAIGPKTIEILETLG